MTGWCRRDRRRGGSVRAGGARKKMAAAGAAAKRIGRKRLKSGVTGETHEHASMFNAWVENEQRKIDISDDLSL
jgi:hypothetical protein